jgi:hypothetical protein
MGIGLCYGPFEVNITNGKCYCKGQRCLNLTLTADDDMGDITAKQYIWKFTEG